MDWSIRSFAQKSDISGVPFQPGDRVISLLMRIQGQAEIARFDFLEQEADQFQTEGGLLGKWTTVIRDDHETTEDKRERRLRKLGSLDELFISLVNPDTTGEERAVEDDDVVQDRQLLCYLVALTLERKKILRLKEKESTSLVLRYQHAQRDETYEVVVVKPSADRLLRVQDALSGLL
jgi:hypothetical protein